METKHSPSPWSRKDLHPRYALQTIYSANGSYVGEVVKANARLIAAAPELLSALRDALEALDDVGDSFADSDLSDRLYSFDKFKRAVVNAALAIRNAAGTEG